MEGNKWIEVRKDGRRQKFPISTITSVVLKEHDLDTSEAWVEVTVSTGADPHKEYYTWGFESADADKANKLFDILHGDFRGDVYAVDPFVYAILENERRDNI